MPWQVQEWSTVFEELSPDTAAEGVTFEVLDVRRSLNPDYPDWHKILREDLAKDPELTPTERVQQIL